MRNWRKKDTGFSLIEVLVVVLVIGVLSSIAVPFFLNQQKAAESAALETSLKSIASQVSAERQQNSGKYPPILPRNVTVPPYTVLDYQYNAEGTMFLLTGENRFTKLYAYPLQGQIVVSEAPPADFVPSTAPIAPILSASLTEDNKPILTWTNTHPDTEATLIYRTSPDPNVKCNTGQLAVFPILDGSTTWKSPSPITTSTTYCVQHAIGVDASLDSNKVTLHVNTGKPAPPQNFEITDIIHPDGYSAGTARWDPVPGATRYSLYEVGKIAPVWQGTQTFRQVEVPITGSSTYFVTAENNLGSSKPSNQHALSGLLGTPIPFWAEIVGTQVWLFHGGNFDAHITRWEVRNPNGLLVANVPTSTPGVYVSINTDPTKRYYMVRGVTATNEATPEYRVDY